MTRDYRRYLNEDECKAADETERALFEFIGKYIVCFQWLEGKLDDIYHLAHGLENYSGNQNALEKLTFSRKTKAVLKEILDGQAFTAGAQIDGWHGRVLKCFEQIERERLRRNSIAHSQYLFDFLAIGGSPIKNDLSKGTSGLSISNEEISQEYRDKVINEVGLLCMEVGFIHQQCVHLIR